MEVNKIQVSRKIKQVKWRKTARKECKRKEWEKGERKRAWISNRRERINFESDLKLKCDHLNDHHFFLHFLSLSSLFLSLLFLFSSHFILLMIWSTHHHSFILSSSLSASLLPLLSFILLLTFNSFTTSLTDQWSNTLSFFFLLSLPLLLEVLIKKWKVFKFWKKLQLKYKNFSNVNDGKETKRWIKIVSNPLFLSLFLSWILFQYSTNQMQHFFKESNFEGIWYKCHQVIWRQVTFLFQFLSLSLFSLSLLYAFFKRSKRERERERERKEERERENWSWIPCHLIWTAVTNLWVQDTTRWRRALLVNLYSLSLSFFFFSLFFSFFFSLFLSLSVPQLFILSQLDS